MHFITTPAVLLKQLAKVLGVVGRGTDLFNQPIFGNVLLRVSDGGAMALTATNTQVEIVAQTDAPEGASAGGVTLSARKLADILRALPNEASLTVEAKQDTVTLSVPGGRYLLKTLPVADFPVMTQAAATWSMQVPAKELATLMRRCVHAMGNQDPRQFLNAMLLDARNGRLHCVASDGHRMCIASQMHAGKDAKVLIPRKAAEELLEIAERTQGQIHIDVDERNLRATADGIAFIAQLVQEAFPDYTKLIPSPEGEPVTVNRQVLVDAIERANILANENHHAITFDLSRNVISVHSVNAEHEDAQEVVDAQTTVTDMKIGFNAYYLLDALRVVPTQDVLLNVRGSSESLLVRPTADAQDLIQIVMPVRV